MSKNGKKGSFIGKVLGTAAVYTAANAAGVGIWAALTNKKMKEHENEHNIMQADVLGKHDVLIKNETQNVYVACLSGCTTINFEGQPEHEDIFIDLFTVIGKVIINLPEGAELDLVGEGHLENIQDNRPEDDEEEIKCTVHITRQSALAELIINKD